MPSDADRIKELELEVERLQGQVDRYRNGCDDAMQQLSWCIGYLTGANKGRFAHALANNLAFIRHNLLNRPVETVPPTPKDEEG